MHDRLEERACCYWSHRKSACYGESASPAKIPHRNVDYLDEDSRAKISEIHHWQYTFLNTPLKKNTPQHGHRGVFLTQTRVFLTHSTDVLQKKKAHVQITICFCHVINSWSRISIHSAGG